MSRIIQSIKSIKKYESIPIILFTKGGGGWLNAMSSTNADVIGLDWTIDLKVARETLSASGKKVAIQGNLEPLILLANQNEIEKRVHESMSNLAEAKIRNDSPLQGHIFNLGHGINLATPPENVQVLIEAVRKSSTQVRLNQ
jgi:uroporphyrinogen decarboxylase